MNWILLVIFGVYLGISGATVLMHDLGLLPGRAPTWSHIGYIIMLVCVLANLIRNIWKRMGE